MIGKTKSSANPATALSERAPPAVASVVPGNLWYERYAKPMLDRDRLFVVAVILGFVCLVLGIAVLRLIPLTSNRVLPVLVSQRASGAVSTIVIHPSATFNPRQATIHYFAARWVRELLGIEGTLTQSDLIRAYRGTVGNATAQFKRFIRLQNPLSRENLHPNETRSVRLRSITWVKPDILIVRVATRTEDAERSVNRRKHLIVTLTYRIVPPHSLTGIYRNPIGFYISNFEIQGGNKS
ncbi:VblB8 protein [mine drainage metagenome]|uniref:VblB8 protein n=1 Tax=mine drainage metagenome TaxID=410659 RepID=T1D226_9ZZZZ